MKSARPKIDMTMTLVDKIRISDKATMLRPVTPDDDAFLELLVEQDYGGGYIDMGVSDKVFKSLMALYRTSQAEEYAESYPRAEHLVIWRAGEPIGTMSLTLETNQFGQCLRLIDMVIRAELRCRGIGRAVLRDVIASARAMRVARMVHTVFLANDRGIKFLRIVGFRTQGVADRAANLTMILPLP